MDIVKHTVMFKARVASPSYAVFMKIELDDHISEFKLDAVQSLKDTYITMFRAPASAQIICTMLIKNGALVIPDQSFVLSAKTESFVYKTYGHPPVISESAPNTNTLFINECPARLVEEKCVIDVVGGDDAMGKWKFTARPHGVHVARGVSVTPVDLSHVTSVEFKLVQHLRWDTSLEAGYVDWVDGCKWEGIPYYNKVAHLTQETDQANIIFSTWNDNSVQTQSVTIHTAGTSSNGQLDNTPIYKQRLEQHKQELHKIQLKLKEEDAILDELIKQKQQSQAITTPAHVASKLVVEDIQDCMVQVKEDLFSHIKQRSRFSGLKKVLRRLFRIRKAFKNAVHPL